jgi:hypothetical protein
MNVPIGPFVARFSGLASEPFMSRLLAHLACFWRDFWLVSNEPIEPFMGRFMHHCSPLFPWSWRVWRVRGGFQYSSPDGGFGGIMTGFRRAYQ